MSGQWLGYPQVVLALWCPLAVLALHRALRPALRHLPAREQFFVAVTAALVPAVAVCVPYLPSLGLRESLPWRAPIAWGISTMDVPAGTSSGVRAALLTTSALPLASLGASAVLGLLEAVASGVRTSRAVVARRGDVHLVNSPELLAFTAGVLLPRVVVSPAVLASPGASAVLAHERAHARAHHPAWVLVATCALRAWWWVPGRRGLLLELRASAELWADSEARRLHGSPAVAAALLGHLDAHARPRAHRLGRAGTAFGGERPCLVRRVDALTQPEVVLTRPVGRLVRGLAVAMAAVVAVLL